MFACTQHKQNVCFYYINYCFSFLYAVNVSFPSKLINIINMYITSVTLKGKKLITVIDDWWPNNVFLPFVKVYTTKWITCRCLKGKFFIVFNNHLYECEHDGVCLQHVVINWLWQLVNILYMLSIKGSKQNVQSVVIYNTQTHIKNLLKIIFSTEGSLMLMMMMIHIKFFMLNHSKQKVKQRHILLTFIEIKKNNKNISFKQWKSN